jgi:formate dehydrogenase major subunit
MASDGPTGQDVLARIDKLLADRPSRVTHDFSAATTCLTEYRERVIRRLREKGSPPDGRERLARLNAVLSVVVGTHYPVGSPKWEHLEKARHSFAGLIGELQDAGLS